MQTKYVLGLVLSCALLQVSLSVCATGEPTDELVTKYNEMKTTFLQRLDTFFDAVMGTLQRSFQSSEWQAVREIVGSPDEHRTLAATNFLKTLVQEMSPLMDRARTTVLGRYESCVRPLVGEITAEMIDTAKIYLDLFLPAA